MSNRTWRLTPVGRRIFEAEKAEVICVGGFACGKTFNIIQRAYTWALQYPGVPGCIATATGPQINRTILRDMQEEFNEDYGGKQPVINYDYNSQKRVLKFDNGTEIYFQSLDVPWQQLKGPNFGWVIIDEADTCDEKRYAILSARARHRKGPKVSIAFSNPPPLGHWIEERVHDETVQLITASTYENPYLDPATIKRLESQYPPGTPAHRKWMLGQLGVPLEGAVYPEFGPDCIVDEDPRSPAGYVAAMDFGWNNPTAYLLAAVDDDDVITVVDEHYASKLSLSDHAAAIKAMHRRHSGGISTPMIFADHDAQDRHELEALALPTRPAPLGKQITLGIDYVRDRLRTGRLKVHRRCRNVVKEFGTYIWATRGDKAQQDARDLPRKLDDHAMDALRYLVTGLDAAALNDVSLSAKIFTPYR